MKKPNKLTAVLLCVVLLLTLSVNVSADISSETQSITDTQIIPVTDEIIVNVGEDGAEIVKTEISNDNAVMPLAQTSGIINGGIYRIKNVASGKYMNVDYGIDADGTNIYQWTADGSTEQKFKVVYSSSTDSYMLYAMCSSNGNNRVVDVTDTGGNLVNGANVKLYKSGEPPSQQMKIISVGSGQYRIAMNKDTTFALTTYGTSNGSAGGTTSTSAGNIFIATYTSSAYQHWVFELLENPNPSPIGCLDTVSSTLIGGWAYQSNIPNTALTVHIYIINNSTGEQKIIGVTAGGYRADLKNAGYGNGYHAFHYAINWKTYKPGTYTVRAYAIGVNSINPQLSYSPKSFTVRKPMGYLDEVNSTHIRGWAWKPDAPNAAITVYINLKNKNTTDEYGMIATANIYRADLFNAGYGNGYHGFELAIPWKTLTPGDYTVKAYVIDGDTYYLTGSPKTYYNDPETFGTKRSWNDTSYRGTYIPKSGWVQPSFFRYTSQYLSKTYCEFYLDNHNVSNILEYNAGTHEADSKNLYFTVDITNVPKGLDDQMDAYIIYTSLPNPKSDLENDDPFGNRNEEAEVVALGKVEATTYYMSAWWVDYRNGDENDAGQWQLQFAMSGQYIDIGNLWLPSSGDYNTVWSTEGPQVIAPYGKKGGFE